MDFDEQQYEEAMDSLRSWITEQERIKEINANPYTRGRELLSKMLPLVRSGVLPPQAIAEFEQFVNAAVPTRTSPELVTKAINRQLRAGTLSLVEAGQRRILANNLPPSLGDPDRWFPPAA